MVLRLANSNQSRRQMIFEKFLFFFTFKKTAALTVITLLPVVEVCGITFIIYISIFTSGRNRQILNLFLKDYSTLGDFMNENNMK